VPPQWCDCLACGVIKAKAKEIVAQGQVPKHCGGRGVERSSNIVLCESGESQRSKQAPFSFLAACGSVLSNPTTLLQTFMDKWHAG
jgi:hypothetical protein